MRSCIGTLQPRWRPAPSPDKSVSGVARRTCCTVASRVGSREVCQGQTSSRKTRSRPDGAPSLKTWCPEPWRCAAEARSTRCDGQKRPHVPSCTRPLTILLAANPVLQPIASLSKLQEKPVSKVLVLYYSTDGDVDVMSQAVAEGARSTGTQVDIKRVPEIVPAEIARPVARRSLCSRSSPT